MQGKEARKGNEDAQIRIEKHRMQSICAKDHGGLKCPSVVPFEILHSEVPFEVDSFEHFGLERHYNMAAMIVFTPKCPSEGDISRLERTIHLGFLCRFTFRKSAPSSVPVVAKLQQDPHTAWSFTGVTAPENTEYVCVSSESLNMHGTILTSHTTQQIQDIHTIQPPVY